MINIKYLKDKITFTCIYCHYYVVREYSAYMIMQIMLTCHVMASI